MYVDRILIYTDYHGFKHRKKGSHPLELSIILTYVPNLRAMCLSFIKLYFSQMN